MASSTVNLTRYVGLSSQGGGTISGTSHLTQSLRDIITTPIGSRVMRRDYGSRVPSLMDGPMTRSLFADVIAATAEAVTAWEPRIRLKRVQVIEVSPGKLSLALIDREGIRYEVGGV